MKFTSKEVRKKKFKRGDLCEARWSFKEWKKAIVTNVRDASDFEKKALNLKTEEELWIYEVRWSTCDGIDGWTCWQPVRKLEHV